MKRFVVVTMLAVMIAAAAWAQEGPGRGMRGKGQQMYDPSKAETVSGQIVEVKEFASRNGVMKGIDVILNAGGRTMLVHLGSQSFLAKQSVQIAAGDQVEITGIKTVRRGQEVFIAGEIKKGGEVLKLRDETGRPLWAGSGPGGGRRYQKAPVGC